MMDCAHLGAGIHHFNIAAYCSRLCPEQEKFYKLHALHSFWPQNMNISSMSGERQCSGCQWGIVAQSRSPCIFSERVREGLRPPGCTEEIIPSCLKGSCLSREIIPV